MRGLIKMKKQIVSVLTAVTVSLILAGLAEATLVNLSLSPSTTIATNSIYDGRVPEYAIDGQMSTWWNARSWGRPNEIFYLVVDLGDVFDVNKIFLTSDNSPDWSTDYFIDYRLNVSTDKANWTEVVAHGRLIDSPVPEEVSDTFYFDDLSFRYALYEVNGGTHWAHLTEFEIWSDSNSGPAPVPEPATMFLFSTGIACLIGSRVGEKRRSQGTEIH